MGISELIGYVLFVAMMALAAFLVHVKDKQMDGIRRKLADAVAERNQAVDAANRLQAKYDDATQNSAGAVAKLQQELALYDEIVRTVLPEDKYKVVKYALDQKLSRMRSKGLA